MRDLSTPGVHFVKRGRPSRNFPVRGRFECLLSHGVKEAVFLCDSYGKKKRRSVLLVSLRILKAALSRLDVGPAYYEDPVSRHRLSPGGSRGSYAAAFPGPFLLVLRPGFGTEKWIRWLRSSSLKNGTAVVRRQARSDRRTQYIGILKHHHERYRASLRCGKAPPCCASSQLRRVSLVVLIKPQASMSSFPTGRRFGSFSPRSELASSEEPAGGTGKETAPKKEIGVPNASPRPTRCVNLGMLYSSPRFRDGA